MTARLRAAWHAIRQQTSLKEKDKSEVDTADLDGMLDDADLNELMTARLRAAWHAIRQQTSLEERQDGHWRGGCHHVRLIFED
jgi:hypothetical protein